MMITNHVMLFNIIILNGKIWMNVENGKVFEANIDTNSKVRIDFNQPVYARALRIYPQSWNTHMSMRFDAIYLDDQKLTLVSQKHIFPLE